MDSRWLSTRRLGFSELANNETRAAKRIDTLESAKRLPDPLTVDALSNQLLIYPARPAGSSACTVSRWNPARPLYGSHTYQCNRRGASKRDLVVDTIGIWVGIGLMVIGVLLFGAGRRKRSSAVASNGSVAVGGDNSGSIVNVNRPSAPPAHSDGHGLAITGIIVELIGIGVVLWHIHLVAG